MISRTNSSNKQFIAVILFLAFIVISIISIAKFDSSNDPKKNNSNSNSSNSNMGIDPNTPAVKESKPIVVVTSNNNTNSNIVSNTTSNKTSNKVSNKVSNKTSNITSNSNEIPVSYFITELSANKIYVAGSAKINVDIYPVNATNKKVKFKSTNTNVARVGDDGTIVGISEGVCYIDIEVEGGGSARVQIQVFNRESSNVTPTSNTTSNKTSNSNTNSNKLSNSNSNVNPTVDVIAVGLNYSEVSLDINEIIQLSTTIYPSNATNKTITWLSSSPSVATVSNGRVTAIKEGSTIITARSNNGKYATCRVTVTKPYTPPSDIAVTSLTPTDTSSFTMNQGLTRTIGVTINPSNATNKTITWSSSNSSIVSVSGNGTSVNTATAKVTALAAGTATITARASNGVSTQYTVKVNAKNGWYTEGQERVYYNNGSKLAKKGDFDLTLYGTTAWATSDTPELAAGTKVTITGTEVNGMIAVNTGSKDVAVTANTLLVNLPELMPSINYAMSNAAGSPFVVNGFSNGKYSPEYKLSGVTGVNLYGYGKVYSAKLGRSEYYAPFNYAAAKYLQKALNNARNNRSATCGSSGCSFILYDTYRPTPVEKQVYNSYMSVYNNHRDVQNAVYRNINGFQYSIAWFMTTGYSKHSQGIALDMGLTSYSGNKLNPSNNIKQAQTKYGVLDTSASISYNNTAADELKAIMRTVIDTSIINNSANNCTNTNFHASGGVFFSLPSEWWHFDLRCTTYNNRSYQSFYIK